MSIEKALEELRVKAAELSESQVSEETISADEFAALDEEAQALYELSKKTLGTYIRRAGHNRVGIEREKNKLSKVSDALATVSHNADSDSRDKLYAVRDKMEKTSRKLDDKDFNRQNGIHSAVKRLTKESDESNLTLEDFTAEEIEAFMVSEEFEQLDELSKKTLGSYVMKSAGDLMNKKAKSVELSHASDTINRSKFGLPASAKTALNTAQDNVDAERRGVERKTSKRGYGVMKALDRLTKESEEMTTNIDLGNLFEGEELSEEFKAKVTTVFESAVAARVDEEVARIEEGLKQTALDESTELKEGLVTKVDGYLDYVAEQWMTKNEIALDRGIKADLFESFMTGMKTLFTEHYVNVPEQEIAVLEELNGKVAEMQSKLDESTAKNVELTQALKEVVKQSQIEEATDGMTELEADKFKTLAEELAFDNEESFAQKLSVIRENYFSKNEGKKLVTESVVTDAPVINEDMANKIADPVMSQYASAITRSNS